MINDTRTRYCTAEWSNTIEHRRTSAQNLLPPLLSGWRAPRSGAAPLLICATSLLRSSSLSSSLDVDAFAFFASRAGNKSLSEGGNLVTLRLRAPLGTGEAPLDAFADCGRDSVCSLLAVDRNSWLACFSGAVRGPSSSDSVAESIVTSAVMGLLRGAETSIFESRWVGGTFYSV